MFKCGDLTRSVSVELIHCEVALSNMCISWVWKVENVAVVYRGEIKTITGSNSRFRTHISAFPIWWVDSYCADSKTCLCDRLVGRERSEVYIWKKPWTPFSITVTSGTVHLNTIKSVWLLCSFRATLGEKRIMCYYIGPPSFFLSCYENVYIISMQLG